MATFLVKKGDTVKVLSGKSRGKTAKVLQVLPRESRVIVEGVNIRKRHMKPRRQGEKGQIITSPAPIAVANVMLVCLSCSQPQRSRYVIANGAKARVCRKCGSTI